MSDIVVTVPRDLWESWLAEGDLPGDDPQYESHFWIAPPLPKIVAGDRVYVVAHGALRGYAPLVRVETHCRLRPSRACLLRVGGAVAVSIPEEIRGFQGWRYRWWQREDERPFPQWQNPRARLTVPDPAQAVLL